MACPIGCIGLSRHDRIEVGYDIFACVGAEFLYPDIFCAAGRFLDQQRVAAAKHVGDDAGRANAFSRVAFVERELGIASAHIQDPDLAHHKSSS
jgi:hypothetical protein